MGGATLSRRWLFGLLLCLCAGMMKNTEDAKTPKDEEELDMSEPYTALLQCPVKLTTFVEKVEYSHKHAHKRTCGYVVVIGP